jgi:hypothetical protein
MATATATDYLSKAGNLSGLANAATARTNLSLGSTNNVSFRSVNMSTGAANPSETYTYFNTTAVNNAPSLSLFNASYYDSGSGTFFTSNESFTLNKAGINFVNNPTFDGFVPGAPTSGGSLDYVSGTGVLTLRYFENASTTDDTIIIEPTGVTFADATKQETAFIPADYVTAAAIATTYAPLASPALTGNPTAPTAALADNDTSIATTAFVQQELLSGTANARNLEVYVRNQTGSTIPIGSIVYINGATGNRPTITLAQANNDANSAQTIGFTKTAIANNGFGFVIIRGELENLNTNSLTEGVQLYLSPTTAGTWTTTKPSAPQHLVYVGIVIRAHPTLGVILVSVQNGYELHELHDVALASEANNDLLVYELSTDLWKNKSFSTLGLATLASPTFTGTPSLPTGTTAVTQTAGDNTTALATTAFVKAATPAFATNAQIIAGTSTTTTLAPGNTGFLLADPRLRSLAFSNSSSVAGSGTVTTNSGLAFARQVVLNSFAIGRAAYYYGVVNTANAGFGTSTAKADQVDFSKKVWLSGYTMMGHSGATSYLGDANTTCRVSLAGYSVANTGDMTQKGIGIKKVGGVGSFVILTVHNGTTLTDVATTVTVPDGGGIHWVIYSDGTGNVTLYINGTQAATTTAGPTTATTSGFACYREQVDATVAPTVRQSMNCSGGWLYIE